MSFEQVIDPDNCTVSTTVHNTSTGTPACPGLGCIVRFTCTGLPNLVAAVQARIAGPGGFGPDDRVTAVDGSGGRRCKIRIVHYQTGWNPDTPPGRILKMEPLRSTGQATPHTTGVPTIDVSNLPILGRPGFSVELGTLPPNSPCVLAIGSTLLASPFSLTALGGQPGAFLYVNAPINQPILSSIGGYASVPIPVPSDPRLVGLPLEFQGFAVDLQLPYALQLANTEALGVTVLR